MLKLWNCGKRGRGEEGKKGRREEGNSTERRVPYPAWSCKVSKLVDSPAIVKP
jgi:hypothetical protein